MKLRRPKPVHGFTSQAASLANTRLGNAVAGGFPIAVVLLLLGSPWVGQLEAKSITLVVLAGQSNAVGSGSFAGEPPDGFDQGASYWVPSAADQAVLFSFQMNNSGINAVNPNTGFVVSDTTSGSSPSLRTGLTGQDQTWKDAAKQFPDVYIGPEVGIARGLYDPISSPDVAIVKVAYGGTRIGWWQKGAGNGLFAMLKSRVDAAKGELQNLGFTDVKVDGFFWQQGESDATNSGRASAYQGQLQALIDDFRTDIGTSDTKVVLGGILTNKFSFGSTINAAMQAVAAVESNTAWFSTDDLSIANTDDGIHFDYDGVLEMGTRFASHFEQLSVPEPSGASFLVTAAIVMGLRSARRLTKTYSRPCERRKA